MKKEIERLKRENARLKEKILYLEHRLARQDVTVVSILKQKGLKLIQYNPEKGLLLSPYVDARVEGRFYDLMRRYSFRLFLRDLIAHQDHFTLKDLTRYCSPKVAANYHHFLEEIGLVTKVSDRGYALSVHFVPSIGPTLEWFVAQIFIREFDASAVYGVKFRETPHGGDYDVIAWLDNRLAYVEVKSSPPKGVETTDVRAFYQRLEDLSPHLAFFLVDTELRMKDKIVPLFEEEINRVYGSEGGKLRPVVRLKEELFHVKDNLFLINSRKGIATNLKTCLRHYQRQKSRFAIP